MYNVCTCKAGVDIGLLISRAAADSCRLRGAWHASVPGNHLAARQELQ